MKVLSVVALVFSSLLLAADEKSLLSPTDKADSWRLEQHEGGKGSLRPANDGMEFTVSAVDGPEWHVQAVQTNLDLVEGKKYVLKFQAKASENRSINVSANIDQEDWHAIGLQETVLLGKEYKPFEFIFTAENVVPKKNRIGLALGESKGTVTVKDMTLTAK
jgi:hypothetical protein